MPSAPAPLTGGQSPNSSIPTFYKAIYTSSKQILGPNNPLPRIQKASNSYIASVCAYVWGLPLQQFWEKQGLYTTQTAEGGKPINTFFIGNSINQTSTIVTPNTQVLYTNAFLDLSNQILEVEYPTPEDGTYTLIQVIDPYTNVQFSDGSAYQTSPEGTSSQTFFWSGASDIILEKAKTIDGAIGIASPQAWILGRTEVDPYQTPDGETEAVTPYQQTNMGAGLDLASSYAINKSFDITTVVKDESTYTIPTSLVSQEENSANDFFTQLSNAVYSNSTNTYYSGITNGELNTSGTLYDQSALFNQFGAGTYSIGLTAAADNSGFKAASTDIRNGYRDAKDVVSRISSANTDESTNYWLINTTLGQYKPTYALRGSNWLTGAAVAAVGLGANIAADGTYPQTYQDGEGNLLDGSEDYSISFEQSSLPPINTPGSWSITAYNSNNEIITDTNNSFYIEANDPSATIANNVYALGSVQFPELNETNSTSFALTLSSSSPTTASSEQNRLPTPNSGTFNLVMRLYNPKPANTAAPSNSILSQNNPWIPPSVEHLTTTTNGPLRHSRIHLDKNGDLQPSMQEPGLTSDQNGQYASSQLGGRGTLVLKGGMDQLTGEKLKGRLLATGNAEVISPATTVDWGLKQAGFTKKRRDQLMDQLIGNIHNEMTGESFTRKSKRQHRSTEIAPHQVARSDHKQAVALAKSMAIANAYLGEALSMQWKACKREPNNRPTTMQYAKKVIKFSKKLEENLSQHPDQLTEILLNKSLPLHNTKLKANLIDSSNHSTSMDYYELINFIAESSTT